MINEKEQFITSLILTKTPYTEKKIDTMDIITVPMVYSDDGKVSIAIETWFNKNGKYIKGRPIKKIYRLYFSNSTA